MPSFPRISIITVVYNGEAVLERTIQSIARQTYPSIEYIVVDGKSQDGTVSLIQKYSSVVTKWISEPDTGLYDAMNKGLDLVNGDFVCFMNAGDLFYADDTLHKIFQNYSGEDVLYGAAIKVDEAETTIQKWHKKLPSHLKLSDMKQGMVVCHQALVVRHSMAPKYDLRYRISGDIDWTIRLLQLKPVVKNTGEIHCKFLAGGLSQQNSWKAWAERFLIFCRQFGVGSALISHCKIVFRFLFSNR